MAFDFNRERLAEILRQAGYLVDVVEVVRGHGRRGGEPFILTVDAGGWVTVERERPLAEACVWRARRALRTYDVRTVRREITTIRGMLVQSAELASMVPEIERLLDLPP